MSYHFSSYKTAEEVATDYDKTLKCTDFHHNHWVFAVHEEGTQLFFRNAFLKEWKDWYFIFTEHHKTHVYHKTDLSLVREFIEVPQARLTETGHKDNCFECQKEFSVKELRYDLHPGKDDPDFIVPLCKNCWEII